MMKRGRGCWEMRRGRAGCWEDEGAKGRIPEERKSMIAGKYEEGNEVQDTLRR